MFKSLTFEYSQFFSSNLLFQRFHFGVVVGVVSLKITQVIPIYENGENPTLPAIVLYLWFQ